MYGLYDDMAHNIDIYESMTRVTSTATTPWTNVIIKLLANFNVKPVPLCPGNSSASAQKCIPSWFLLRPNPNSEPRGSKSRTWNSTSLTRTYQTLQQKRSTPAKFQVFRSRNHVPNAVSVDKVCLTAYSDKRYILEDVITTLAYGHENIRWLTCKYWWIFTPCNVYCADNNPKIIAGYYTETVKNTGGVPVPAVVTGDMRTENGSLEIIQKLKVRENAFLYGLSTTNQHTEWRRAFLRKHSIQYWMDILEDTYLWMPGNCAQQVVL